MGGFPAETKAFLEGIAEHNDKAWFEANRALYEAGYVEPARAFIEEVGPRLKAIAPGVRYEGRVNGSIGRINRDVRFSKDKRPYKDHLDIWFWHGEKRSWDCPGFYLRVAPAGIFLGCGMHTLAGATLDRFREAVVAERSGKALERAIARVRAASSYEVGEVRRKTVPRGFDPKHKRAGLLLYEGLYAGIELPATAAYKLDFTDVALGHYAATWPTGKWLLDELYA